jgi:hypothetical protein
MYNKKNIISYIQYKIIFIMAYRKNAVFSWGELWYLTPLSTVISWWSVLLVEEAGGPRENHRPVASH